MSSNKKEKKIQSYLIEDEGFKVGKSTLEDSDESLQKKSLSPFDFINAINVGKEDLFPFEPLTQVREKHSDSEYVKFIVNKSMSYFPDTIVFANLANTFLGNVPNHAHFDFYRFGVTKKKRYSKWFKPVESETLSMVIDYFNVNREKAEEYIKLLSKEQIEEIRKETAINGKQKNG